MVGSLTKVFACPGLRVGYVLTPTADVADAPPPPPTAVEREQPGLRPRPRPPRPGRPPRLAAAVTRLRADLTALLRHHGYTVDAADAPWVLVPAAGDLRRRLAGHGILVRDCASFGLVDTVRMAVPDPAGLDRLARAL